MTEFKLQLRKLAKVLVPRLNPINREYSIGAGLFKESMVSYKNIGNASFLHFQECFRVLLENS